MKRKLFIVFILFLIASVIYILCWQYLLPHGRQSGEDFGIETYKSAVDMDSDGIDDQTDMLQSARAYIATKPEYKSEYYESGYPDGKYGVCTDVIAFAMLGSGYDLMELVNADIAAYPELYPEAADANIDFRRVRNLRVYFERHAISLSTDLADIAEWQGGDIVVFEEHIGIVSDKRNREGIPYVIHNGSPQQLSYEQDILEENKDIIVGHYRIS